MHDAARRVEVVGHDGLDGRVVLHHGHGHRNDSPLRKGKHVIDNGFRSVFSKFLSGAFCAVFAIHTGMLRAKPSKKAALPMSMINATVEAIR